MSRMWLVAALLTVSHGTAKLKLRQRPRQDELRISNPIPDNRHMYLFVVDLVKVWEKDGRNRTLRWCTGSLISPIWVLTAAHVVDKSIKFIQYGDMSKSPDDATETSSILEFVSHPRYRNTDRLLGQHSYYNSETPNNIALVLVEPVTLKEYGKLSAIDFTVLKGASVKYAGYGETGTEDMEGEGYINHNKHALMVADGVISSCPEEKPSLKSVLCVFPKCETPQFALRGDYGAPLFFGKKIVGIMRASLARGDTLMASIWTPVSTHLQWIYQVVVSKCDQYVRSC